MVKQIFQKITIIIFLSITVLVWNRYFISLVNAAFTTSDIATDVTINDTNVQDGDLVSFSPLGYVLSKIPYDPYLSGVVLLHPAVSLVTNSEPNTYPIVRSGTVSVRVSGVGGSIAKGDLLTSSSTPGVAMKTTQAGYVIGAAVESYSPRKPQDIGRVTITLDTHYFAAKTTVQSSFKDIFTLSKIATYQEPSLVIKYLIVAAIVLISFASGFVIFEKTVVRGIDSIGRNPLAAHIIELGMLVSMLVTIAVTMGGLFIAYLVLRL